MQIFLGLRDCLVSHDAVYAWISWTSGGLSHGSKPLNHPGPYNTPDDNSRLPTKDCEHCLEWLEANRDTDDPRVLAVATIWTSQFHSWQFGGTHEIQRRSLASAFIQLLDTFKSREEVTHQPCNTVFSQGKGEWMQIYNPWGTSGKQERAASALQKIWFREVSGS